MAVRTRPIRRIVFGITTHGLGHLTRACQLANALCEIDSSLEFHFWCDLPRERIASELKMEFHHRPIGYEPGTAQRSCFELDADQTVRNYQSFMAERESRLDAERRALERLRCDAVVCDVPALLVRAASDLDIPTIAVSNFTWDWILDPILAGTAAEPALELLRDDYQRATHHIQLPFGPEQSPIRSREKGPLISRRADLAVDDVKSMLGLATTNRSRPVVLVCPGGWDPDGWQHIHPDTQDFDLVLVGDLPVTTRVGDIHLAHELPAPIRFPDLVNAADVVLAKPGYGIASECVSHQTPLVTIDRPGFRETNLLRRELAEFGPCAELSLDNFFAGRWKDAVETALSCETPWAGGNVDRADLDIAQCVRSKLGWC